MIVVATKIFFKIADSILPKLRRISWPNWLCYQGGGFHGSYLYNFENNIFDTWTFQGLRLGIVCLFYPQKILFL